MTFTYKAKVPENKGIINQILQHKERGKQALQETVAEVTLLSKGIIAEYISAVGLVDTGFYKNSWVVDLSQPFVGILSTNCAYALVLELGFDGVEQVKAHSRKGRPVRAHQRKVKRTGYGAASHTFLEGRRLLRATLERKLKAIA